LKNSISWAKNFNSTPMSFLTARAITWHVAV